ncbi:MAG: hypothetical protein C0399_10910 [Syntrophus sp. (in: bacteria)]|nr:hypothetical protein [Syntrophus sp. (in: bacteria)]
MQLFVNNRAVDLLPGMKIIHALIGAGLDAELKRGKRVYDEWGNKVGLDGELTAGIKLFVR